MYGSAHRLPVLPSSTVPYLHHFRVFSHDIHYTPEESTCPLFRSVFSLFHRSNDVHGCCMVFRRSSRTQRILLLSCLTFLFTLLLSNYLARSVILISWYACTSRKLRIVSGQSLRFSERESLIHSFPFQTSNHSSIPAGSG